MNGTWGLKGRLGHQMKERLDPCPRWHVSGGKLLVERGPVAS